MSKITLSGKRSKDVALKASELFYRSKVQLKTALVVVNASEGDFEGGYKMDNIAYQIEELYEFASECEAFFENLASEILKKDKETT